MIYLHSTDERQREIADAVDEFVRSELARPNRERRLSMAAERARSGHDVVKAADEDHYAAHRRRL